MIQSGESEPRPKQGRPGELIAAPQFATCGADDADGVNAVVPVGREALLFRWRGYADPASRTRPAPRFHAPRGLMAETLTPPLLAEHEGSDQHARDTCFVFAAVVDDGDRRGRARGRPPAVTDHGRSLARRLGGSRDPG
jgi:hypothetical protein